MKPIRIIFGLAFALVCALAASIGGLPSIIVVTIAITALTGAWWVTEALPIPATSLVPFALFPLAGVLTHREAAASLGSHVILLLMASFMLSKALEKSLLHERLALYMINLVGTSGRRLVFGFMFAAAVLSMWISNSATTLMLATMALAILSQSENQRLAIPLLLGIAYAASLGGTATPIGTPPNLIFLDAYQQATGDEFSFSRWMRITGPIVLIGIPLMGVCLTRNLRDVEAPPLRDPGSWKTDEIRTLIVFGIAITAWITRAEPFGGWTGVLNLPGVGDSTIGLAAVLLMFLVPDGRGGALLDWKTANNIPWGMLLLFAGGICIATAFRESGLADLIAAQLSAFATAPPLIMLLGLCLSITFLTEMTSNTATANLLMPLLAATAVGTGVAPEILMIPAIITCSCAFMLPVATAPNAIIYATGKIPMKRMAQEGAILNVMIAILVAVSCWLTLSP